MLFRRPAALPAPSSMPGLMAALGLIVVYFVLQLGWQWLLKAGAGLLAYAIAPQQASAMLAHWLEQPDLILLLLSLGLSGAAGSILLLIRWLWPAYWPQADPPGLGFAASHLRNYGRAILLALLVSWLGESLTHMLTGGRDVQQLIEQLALRAGLPMRFLFTLVAISLGPLVEEALFRGVLFSALCRLLAPGWAILASAMLFAWVHLGGLYFQWHGLPELLLLGLLLAWLRWRCHSIWPAVLAHGTHNLLAMVLLLGGASQGNSP